MKREDPQMIFIIAESMFVHNRSLFLDTETHIHKPIVH